MSDIWLVGAGGMARDYIKVLQAIGRPFEVVGRGEESARKLESETGVEVLRGGIEQHLRSRKSLPTHAIVCVGVEALGDTTRQLVAAGVEKVLVEKPAGLHPGDIVRLNEQVSSRRAVVIVAYNRRCYASVLAARRFLDEDGGVTSYHFEFTEWSHVIRPLHKVPGAKERWFLGNSTHVVDLAFFLGGAPKDIACFVTGALDWHPAGSAFAGAGVSVLGAPFSYCGNWAAPGRWSVEVCSSRRRFIFRPLEKLQVQMIGSVAIEPIAVDDQLDIQYKAGLFVQAQRFLRGDLQGMCTLEEHCALLPVYCRMAGYSMC